MNNELKKGFSLTEVLLAVGILAVGMIFIAGVFPVAIHFTTVATERTIAAVAADEAFAKIRLYRIDLSSPRLSPTACVDFNDVIPAAVDVNESDFVYPSTGTDIMRKQYCWSALCRDTGNRSVQVTVFVCRKTGPGLRYPEDNLDVPEYDWPRPAIVGVEEAGAKNELRIRLRPGASGDKRFINDGYTIVDNETGRLYRVSERYSDDPATPAVDEEKVILLDRDWDDSDPGGPPKEVWVVPPPVNGGRGPCLTIYQKVIQF